MSVKIQETILTLKEFLLEVDNLSYIVEHSKEYHEMTKDPELGKLFFHAYLKCRRSFIAIDELVKSEVTSKFKHAYIEAFPFLRIMTECYIHFCYITDEKIDKDRMLKDYQAIQNNQLKKIINISTIDFGKNKEEIKKNKAFIRKFKKDKYENPSFFNDMPKLAKITGNEKLYKIISTKYSSYIHFNPINYSVYGTFKDGVFTFNDLDKSSRRLEGELLFYCIDIMMRLIGQACNFINIPVFKELVTTFQYWKGERDKFQTILFK